MLKHFKEVLLLHLSTGARDPSAMMAEIYSETIELMKIHYSIYRLDTVCLTPHMVQSDFEDHLEKVLIRKINMMKAAMEIAQGEDS